MNRMAAICLCLLSVLLVTACHVIKPESGSVSLLPQSVELTRPENTPVGDAGFGAAPNNGGAVVDLTEEQNGGDVSLIVNDALQIQLVGNPTTGFTWEAENLDASHLEQIGVPVFAPDSNLIGASGQFTLVFKALRSGVVTLSLVYHRSFETNVPPQRMFEVTVSIQD